MTPRYALVVPGRAAEGTEWSVRDKESDRCTEGRYQFEDAVALRDWLNERDAGYPSRVKFVNGR